MQSNARCFFISKAKRVEEIANSLYNLGDTESNINAYMRNKPVHDFLDEHRIRFVSQISPVEFIVDAGKTIIVSHTGHSLSKVIRRTNERK